MKSLIPASLRQREFFQDESGAITIFGLYLFAASAAVSAIAVDVAHIMAARSQLQATADSAAHAALYLRETNSAEDSISEALALAKATMDPDRFGDVLPEARLEFGTWDYITGTFTPDGSSKTAVRAIPARVAGEGNAIGSLLFQMVGLRSFDMATPSVFTTFYPSCFREGFVAQGVVDIQSNNGFSNGFCVHSNTYVSLNSNNTFEPGTVVSMPSTDDVDLPRSGYETNEGLQAALRSGVYRMRLLGKMEDIIYGLKTGDAEYLPDYISTSLPVQITGNSFDESTLLPGYVYSHTCGGNSVTLSSSVALDAIVFVSNCNIKLSAGTVLIDTIVATTSLNAKSINSPSSLQVGENDSCADGGGAQLLTYGGMDFAADLRLYGGQLLAQGDINFAANADGIEGASMIAGGEINGTSNMDMGFCGTGMDDNFEAPYFRMAL